MKKIDLAAPHDQASAPEPPAGERKRRPRYSGKNPRTFHEKYKELNPERYAADVRKVLDSGKTPAGSHRPILLADVLHWLRAKGRGYQTRINAILREAMVREVG